MSTFRDELMVALGATDKPSPIHDGCNYAAFTLDGGGMWCNKCGWGWSIIPTRTIDALLASEPMQAIRRTLLQHAEEAATEYNYRWAAYRSTTVRRELADLPDNVIDWVMEGNE